MIGAQGGLSDGQRPLPSGERIIIATQPAIGSSEINQALCGVGVIGA
jgi:hypothetical protein